MKSKPTIVVSLPLVWGVRNVLRSGLYDELSRDFRVILAAPEDGQADLLREGIDRDDLWILDHPRETAPHSRLMKALKAAHARRHPTPSDQIFGDWTKRTVNGKNGNARHRISEAVYQGIGLLASNPRLFSWLERNEDAAYQRMIPRRTWDVLQKTKPIFGLSTSHVVNWEWALFRAMHALHIPIATHILSFDNLTTRGYIPTKHFGHFLVWQEAMADELRRFYGISENQITVTGTPQFDFHVREDFRWTRKRTAQVLGIDSQRPYFLHCANHHAMTPGEPELIAAVLREASADPRFRRHQWILRLHPLDDYQRWEPLQKQFDAVRLSRPWSQGRHAAFWGTPSCDELALLANTLRYADATLTMGSSTALDSAVVDTPIICVGFHPRAGSAEDRFYRESHFSHHYRPIMESKAAPLATSMSELMDQLGRAVADRGALRKERACLVARVCGRVDGNAAQRIADRVINLVNTRATPGRQPILNVTS
ncbi:MAG TPA: CDP-glycerol glycerophosphotransferase family protein [Verrucomicrobiae bacterium]|nr:CDP-glycerol glycerophosphotransferase family protein [Verrucomicrobiae bacterium]